jgi:hypothetical protein
VESDIRERYPDFGPTLAAEKLAELLRQDFGNQLLKPGAARDRSEIAADVDALSN